MPRLDCPSVSAETLACLCGYSHFMCWLDYLLLCRGDSPGLSECERRNPKLTLTLSAETLTLPQNAILPT